MAQIENWTKNMFLNCTCIDVYFCVSMYLHDVLNRSVLCDYIVYTAACRKQTYMSI